MKIILFTATKSKGKHKRVFILPVIFAAISAIINVGSMAAIGYFSSDRDINEGTQTILNIDEATPALQRLQPAVTAIARVCIAALFLSRRDAF